MDGILQIEMTFFVTCTLTHYFLEMVLKFFRLKHVLLYDY